MPRVHDCPRCGAPLPSAGDAALVACQYCDAEVHLAKQPRSGERSARAGSASPERSRDEAQRGKWLLAAALLAALLVVPVVVKVTAKGGIGPRTVENPAEKIFRTFETATAFDDAVALFVEHGVQKNDSRITVDFREALGVRRAELHYAADRREVVRLNLFGKFDVDAVVAKLREIAPNHLAEGGPMPRATTRRLQVGDAVIDLSPASVSLSHWDAAHPSSRDPIACRPRLSAFWSVLRYALFEGSPPDDATRKLITGPNLKEALSLDRTLVIEQASDSVEKASSVARCRMQAGLGCSMEVDHPLVQEATWRWPNALKARVQRLELAFRKRPNAAKSLGPIAACLKPALGDGEERVVDYAQGTRAWSWSIGSSGDRAELLEQSLTLMSGDGAKPEVAAEWTTKVDAVEAALAHCAP